MPNTSGASIGAAADQILKEVNDRAADLIVLDAPSHDYLAYRPGIPMTHAVFRRGVRVA